MITGKALKNRTDRFADATGRRPRIYVTPVDGVGKDRAVKALAAEFADLGFDVDLNTLAQTPQQVARAAVENDVHVIGLTGLSPGHRILLRQLSDALEQQGADTILIALWGRDILEESRYGGVPVVVFPDEMPGEKCAATILDVITPVAQGSGRG